MSLLSVPGTWRAFLERGGSSGLQNSEDDTQPPSQPMEMEEVAIRIIENDPPQAPIQQLIHVPLMTLEELLLAPGRTHLPKLHPLRSDGAGWFGYTKGITKTVKKIMENDYPDAAPNWSKLKGDTKKRWFKAFAQKYNWEYVHTTYVREEFESLCSSRLLDRVYDWKILWRNDPDNKLSWMKDSVWTGLIVYWTLEKTIKRSKTNSENRYSTRGGFGIAKHTCGSCPYIRMRENMRDEQTGELPDMVTFMERTHKRKRDGVFVDKKAEAIAKKCREQEQLKLTQMAEAEETCEETELSKAQKNAIYLSEVELIHGRRFGVGRIENDDAMPKAIDSTDYKAMYFDTCTKLLEATNKIDLLSSQVQDAVFWSSVMRSMYPDQVPPSQAPTDATRGETNTSG